jgi:uncharacterized repeat protein (TIGR01451 family)
MVVALGLPIALAGPARAAALTTFDNASGAFVYTKASSAKCSTCLYSATRSEVKIMPGGTATFQVAGTANVTVRVWGASRTYSVSVDGGGPTSYSTNGCVCWETDPVASGLSLTTHSIVATDTSPALLNPYPTNDLDIQAWFVDWGGLALQSWRYYKSTSSLITYSSVTFVQDPNTQSGTLAMVPAGSAVSFWLQNTANFQLEVVDNGAVLSVAQSNKLNTWSVTLANTGRYKAYHVADWGLPPGLLRVSVTVTSGTLALDQVALSQTATLGAGTLVSVLTAAGSPLIGAYGDSITVGSFSLGPSGTSSGFADQLASLRGLRLSDQAYSGTAAWCYGQYHASSLAPYYPGRIIVAYGVNDLTGAWGCKPSLDQFRSAIDAIITKAQASMPGVPIYLSSILQAPASLQQSRLTWNQAIAGEAALHGLLYVDPSPGMDPATDFEDTVHPNNSGAAKVASAWSAAIPWGSADLTVSNSASPATVPAGGVLTYSVTVANKGPAAATSPTVTDVLPTGMAFVSATASQGSCTGTSTVLCNLGSVAVGATATVAIKGKPTVVKSTTDKASVAGWEADPHTNTNVASATASVARGNADTAVAVQASASTVQAGSDVTFTVTASNGGPDPATAVQVTNALPDGLSFVSAQTTAGSCTGASTVTCSIGTLDPGTSDTITIVAHADQPGDATVSSTVASGATDPDPSNNQASATISVTPQPADLALTMTDSPDPVATDNDLTYTITVTNQGPGGATEATVTDQLPDGETLVSATATQGTCDSSGGPVACDLGSLDSAASATVTVVVTPSAPGQISNTATVAAAEPDPDASNDSATVTTTVV